MKKIALTVFVCAAMSGAFCFAANAPETTEALKAKIAKLEAQVREDVEIIRALRAENRALKRQLRGIKKASEQPKKVAQENPAKPDAARSAAAQAAQERREAIRRRAERAEEDADLPPESPKSSVWDHMFPF